MVHKVKGKEVEKLREEERKQEEFEKAKHETLMKIDDYGKRKEILDNADTTYLTNTEHDVSTSLNHFRFWYFQLIIHFSLVDIHLRQHDIMSGQSFLSRVHIQSIMFLTKLQLCNVYIYSG